MIYTRKHSYNPPAKTSWLTTSILVLLAIALGQWTAGWTMPTYAPTSKVKAQEKHKTVEEQILSIAQQENYQAPLFLVRLAKCESSLNPTKVGIAVGCPSCKGLFQIHTRANGVTDEQAFDVEYSTRWAINKLKQGKTGLWPVCSRIS